MTSLDRRSFLRVGALAGGTLAATAAAGAPLAQAAVGGKRRVYVLVVDGCRPDEIGADLTPRLAALRNHGTNFPRAESLPVMETIPNHVMMMTGVRPDRSGVPANSVYDRDEQVVRDLDRPGDLRFPTVISRLNRQGFTTGTVLSKEYLYGIFGTRATYRWSRSRCCRSPATRPTRSRWTPRSRDGRAVRPEPGLRQPRRLRPGRALRPDRHHPAGRPAGRAGRRGHPGRPVRGPAQEQRPVGTSVVLVLADHSMDWSRPSRLVSLAPRFEDDPMLAGPRADRAERRRGPAVLDRRRGPSYGGGGADARIALAADGVLSAHAPADCG